MWILGLGVVLKPIQGIGDSTPDAIGQIRGRFVYATALASTSRFHLQFFQKFQKRLARQVPSMVARLPLFVAKRLLCAHPPGSQKIAMLTAPRGLLTPKAPRTEQCDRTILCFDFRSQPKPRYYLALDPVLAGAWRVNKTKRSIHMD